jgi:hypothetical protein
MERFDIINEIISKYNTKNYLEIGVRNPWECFDRINCSVKMSVDPGIESDANMATYPFYSDDFFNKLNKGELDLPKDYKWDIIFIDGLHLAEQCFRDFENALSHCSDNGFIAFHDASPPTIYHAREDYYDHSSPAGGWWNGTVWKTIQRVRTDYDLDLVTVDSDWGVTVIKNKPSYSLLSKNINPFYDYNTFNKHRNKILNLVSVEEFKYWL